MSIYKKEFIKSIREYVFSKALTMFKKLLEVQLQIQYDDVFSTETWDPILKKINNEIIFYCNIQENPESEPESEPEPEDSSTKINTSVSAMLDTLYPSETLKDYVQRIGSLKQLGAYEYVDFYRKLKIPEFRKHIKQGHEEIEKIKLVKREIVLYVLSTLEYLKPQIESIECINLIPVYEHISEKNIDSSNLEQEPLYKDFRKNKQQYCEMYTLWAIKNI
jgi:hypothetical protein